MSEIRYIITGKSTFTQEVPELEQEVAGIIKGLKD